MKKFALLTPFLNVVLASQALAQAPGAGQIVSSPWDSCLSGPNRNVATLACVPIVLQNIINFLALFAGVVAIFLLIYAGYRFITSEGDPQKVANARRTMIFVLWGIIIVVVSFAILMLISQFTGVRSIAPRI